MPGPACLTSRGEFHEVPPACLVGHNGAFRHAGSVRPHKTGGPQVVTFDNFVEIYTISSTLQMRKQSPGIQSAFTNVT